MMTEKLRYFQVQTPTVSGLVNATEFRTSKGNIYTVTVISDKGYSTIPVSSREEAIECADNYIREFAQAMAVAYGVPLAI